MTQIEKLIVKFLKNPGSVRYDQIKKILLKLGFEYLPVQGGSHEKFKHHSLDRDLVIPLHHNDCKTFYKDLAAKLIIKNHLY
ncbi:MAG: type II toxin-antitoxin system HicA family toxin [Candidatus Peregrinibacteria bacterium]|nr:type II toxin-antitoxin system HicA family toxin [Candidatus Peregrinibacteria bacterium]